jgi:hypothetical protein
MVLLMMHFRKYSKSLIFSFAIFLGLLVVIQFNTKNKIGLNQPIPIIYLDLDENLRNTIDSRKRNYFYLIFKKGQKNKNLPKNMVASPDYFLNTV